MDYSFYKGKRIFITGHTGFKGTWLCHILLKAEADITGYALSPSCSSPNLFTLCGTENKIDSVVGDIRDYENLRNTFLKFQPEIVLHLAAQPLVRESYRNPRYTYETNVMGTVNLCECIRECGSVRSFLNVTTDKVYKNNEWEWGYRENEPLDGFDPYSNSKSCSELVTHSYMNAFYSEMGIAVSTARAGNVIGGGDFAQDRILPDCVKAAKDHQSITVRNPYSTRPYQHVLEPLFAYLMIAQKQYEDKSYAGFYNVGPDDGDCITTGELVDIFCKIWGNNIMWIEQGDTGPQEANFLKLDCSKLKKTFGWRPTWDVTRAVQKTVEWSKIYLNNGDIIKCINDQIDEFYVNLKEVTTSGRNAPIQINNSNDAIKILYL